MPADVERIMTEGVMIDMDADHGAFEIAQYPYPDDQALMESLIEADRALAVGHMEYVPECEVERVLNENVVHPWLMVWQGKWRLCQDYSGGTNLGARSGPFGLPSAWDARHALKPGSYMSKYDLRDFFWSIPMHPESRRRLVMRHPGTGRLMWCRSLPFGYLDSPRQSCRVSEALAGEMRRRAAGRAIHFFCYVDDYLVIGDTKDLTHEGDQIFEEVMRDFGMQWAPAKQRGPVQCLEFLGLLLCNVEGHRCIALSEKRQRKLMEMIEKWLARRPRHDELLAADPKELASLLGHLVFASQVVPGGRTYMQNMLSVFGGLEVDWRHGQVRARHGEWQRVEVTREFWLDLEWWRDHLENRNCISLEEAVRCEAMITGTDASDWGVGTVVWIDGHKEECNLAFTRAEKRRPINFRELLGIVRIVELYGHRLKGCRVMIETDNMAAKGAAEKLASVAASMQEMLRRLYEAAEKYSIAIVPVHTPGAKLFRPDQTSRGDPIEEPRLRLNAFEYELFEKRFGPFDEFVGAERRHPQSSSDGANGDLRVWLHPAHNTVGSALRLLGERMAGYDGDAASRLGPPLSGIIVVPDASDAQWWGLLKHFSVVGRWEVGDTHLEMNQLGVWKPVRALRASLALLFPRALGNQMKKVEVSVEANTYSGYVQSADKADMQMLPLPVGSFVYYPSDEDGEHGVLLMVWHAFRPDVNGRELDEEGEVRASCVELLLKKSKSGRSLVHKFDSRIGSKGGSFAGDERGRPTAWEVSAHLLYTVDHLVKVDEDLKLTMGGKGGTDAPHLRPAQVEKRTFTFDYVQADREIAHLKSQSNLNAQGLGAGGMEDLGSNLAALDLQGAEPLEPDAHTDLKRARASADEAALMRTRPQKQEKTPSPRPPATVDNRRATVCRYHSQYCEGCGGKFEYGEKIEPGFRAMIHPNASCLGLAAEAHETRLTGELCPPCGGEIAKSTVMSAKLASLTDGERLASVRKCLSGKCGETREERVTCLRGCGRGVHLVACVHTSKAYAASGRLICLNCRLEEIMESGDAGSAPASIVQQVTLTLVAELTSGAVSTAAGRNQFTSLERRWAMESLGVGGDERVAVKLPRHNVESFITFMWWLITDADRARSFGTLMRAAGAVMTMLELTDWTKTTRVKALMKDIEKRCGVEVEPCTQTTRRIVQLMATKTIKKVCSRGASTELNEILRARTMLLLILELLAGLRVGEATSSGDLHGLEANNTLFLTPLSTPVDDGLGETIEVMVKDSKTGPGRHAAFVAKTEGACELEGSLILRDWIRITGMAMEETIEGGFKVEKPNYFVVRLNLAPLTKADVSKLLREVASSKCAAITENAAATAKYIKERYKSTTVDSDAKYVNLCGGKRLGKDRFSFPISSALAWAKAIGLERHVFVVPGPLVRSTLGKKLTHMPLATTSTYTHLVSAIKEAHTISEGMEDPDPEFDLQGLEKPKFGNHSLRRHSDKVARESLPLHADLGRVELTKRVIDYFYGWLLKEMKKDMQLHYAGLDRRARRVLAFVSMYM